MSVDSPFNPAYTQGQTVTTAAATASIEIGQGNKTFCLTNTGSAYCYVRSGSSGVVATSADYIVPPGSQVMITKYQEDTHLAYIWLTGATALNVMAGEGY